MPYLQAGLDVDGCDVSADMIAVCREKAERAGLSPSLYVQPMHELELPRTYRTIVVCGSFGLGSSREQCFQALDRFREHLSPGGTLLVDTEVPYADARQWKYWLAEERSSLPEAARAPGQRRAAADGAEYALSARIVALDPLRQQVTLEMTAQMWRDDTLEAEETHVLDISLFFPNELRLMLERAGFENVVVHGEHEEREPTGADEFVVLVAR